MKITEQTHKNNRKLSESCLMNTNTPGFRCFLNICVLVLWTIVAPALERSKET